MSAPRRPQPIFWVLMAMLAIAVGALVFQGEAGNVFGLAQGEFAHVAYLVILLVFVGSALLGRGLGAGEVVRSAAAWLAILLVIVGAYAYRDELSGAGARILGVLAPGIPVPGRLAGGIDEDSVMITRSMDGHFAVRASIDIVPVTLMVDTGASFVTLTTADARRIGIDTSGLRFTSPVRTANGTINTAQVTLDRISVGPIERRNVPALVAPQGSLDQSLLGLSFLNTLHGYTITGDRLILTP